MEGIKPQSEEPQLLGKEHFDFQLRFAIELQKKTAEPLAAVLYENTSLYGPGFFSDQATLAFEDGLTPENASERAYQNYLKFVNPPASEGMRRREQFGCFGYQYYPEGVLKEHEGGTVRIHFNNHESRKIGPLSDEALDARRRELREMLTHIRDTHPDAINIEGDSWLYHIPAYKRLFPDSYLATAQVDTDPNNWKRLTIWGQFMDSDDKLKSEVAERFLERVEELPADEALEALPYPPLKVSGKLEDFYRLYGLV